MAREEPAALTSAGLVALVGNKVRSRAVWSLSLFTAALPVAFLAGPPDASTAGGRALLGSLFWASGAVMGLLAAWVCIRYWPILPRGTRWLGLLPAGGAAFVGLLLLLAVTFSSGPP